MTDIDDDLKFKIIETHTDMRHVRKQLEGGKETFKEHYERIRDLENTKGKIMALIVFVGGLITLVFNFVLWLAARIWK